MQNVQYAELTSLASTEWLYMGQCDTLLQLFHIYSIAAIPRTAAVGALNLQDLKFDGPNRRAGK